MAYYKSIISSYIILLVNGETDLRFIEKLYEVFISTCIWKEKKALKIVYKKTFGIYVIYHKQTFTAYVGESMDIEKLFYEHYNQLSDGTHFNKGLLKSVSDYGLDTFEFFIIKYGDSLKEKNRHIVKKSKSN